MVLGIFYLSFLSQEWQMLGKRLLLLSTLVLTSPQEGQGEELLDQQVLLGSRINILMVGNYGSISFWSQALWALSPLGLSLLLTSCQHMKYFQHLKNLVHAKLIHLEILSASYVAHPRALSFTEDWDAVILLSNSHPRLQLQPEIDICNLSQRVKMRLHELIVLWLPFSLHLGLSKVRYCK